MKLTKLEKLSYVGAPWFFGIVMTVVGNIVANANPKGLHGIVLISAGLICMSLFCVCALLVKIIPSDKA